MSEAPNDPLVGNIVDGRYLVRERVAQGGMATVYLATDRRLGREVALKLMNPAVQDAAAAQDFLTRFRREARAAARLTHPGMVRVYDQGTDGDASYLTMEFVTGQTLRERLNSDGPMQVAEALTIADRILDALAAAHRQGLIHRDIKPENILFDSEGEPKIADFGLARAVTEVTATTTGTIMGTVAYLGPELVQAGTSDARTDVYAVGILLFEMLTGRQPFTGASAIDVAHRHVSEDIPVPSGFVAWLPPEIDQLVAELAARAPDARPGDASEALAQLRRTRTMLDDPTLARRADPPSGTMVVSSQDAETTVLTDPPTGSTVALPIGLGEPEEAATDPETLPQTTSSSTDIHPPRSVGWWVGAGAAAVLALSSLVFWWYTSFGPGAYTEVPDVSTMLVSEATETLQSQGLAVNTIQSWDDAIIAGNIIGTDPAAGEQVQKTGTVTIIVSRGPRMVVTPVLTGILEEDALLRIEAASFTHDPVVEYAYSDTVPAGEVIAASIDPETETQVRHDTIVSLTVSQGPEPVTIPSVIGATQQTAIQALEGLGLDVKVVEGRTLDTQVGRVYDQDPAGDTAGFRTDQVSIWVSIGKPLVEVPNFTGLNEELARNSAENRGLNVNVTDRPFTFCAAICGQSVAPGDEVEVGTTIELWY